MSWITEINELFHDILIYWDAPVFKPICSVVRMDQKHWHISQNIFLYVSQSDMSVSEYDRIFIFGRTIP